MPARRRRTPKPSDEQKTPPHSEIELELERTDRMYDFGNTPVLLLHPSVNRGAVATSTLTGYWVTRSRSREEFDVIDLFACLVVPALEVQLPGDRAPRQVRPGTIFVGYRDVSVPSQFEGVFGNRANTGRVDAKSRVYTATFGAEVTFPFATADGERLELKAAPILWLNVGSVARGGALNATSLGRIMSGVFEGLQLCCGHGTPRPLPPPAARCTSIDPQTGVQCQRPPHPPVRGSHVNNFFGGRRW